MTFSLGELVAIAMLGMTLAGFLVARFDNSSKRLEAMKDSLFKDYITRKEFDIERDHINASLTDLKLTVKDGFGRGDQQHQRLRDDMTGVMLALHVKPRGEHADEEA